MAKVGKPKLMESPERLWELYEKYRNKVYNNPIKVKDYVGRDAKVVYREHTAPLNWRGFEIFLFEEGIGNCRAYVNLDWYRRNQNEAYTEFQGVIRAIASDMFNSKFTGAAIGTYNPSIIARELHLAEPHEMNVIQRPVLEQGKALPADNEINIDDLL